MKLFLDSANLVELESGLKSGLLSGITTNPSILSKEPKADLIAHMQQMIALCRQYQQPLPLSVEVFTDDPCEMLSQAHKWVEKIDYEHLVIKIPIGWGELEVIHQLAKENIPVNCTCLFNEAQCALAANAGARYLSIFMGRLKDIGTDPLPVISNVRRLLDQSAAKAEIIVGSIRHPRDITDAQTAGGHIVTASLKFFQTMSHHPQTIKSVQGFLDDFRKWNALPL